MNIENNVFFIQVAFFFSQNSNISIVKMAGQMQEEFQTVFSNDPEILSLPNNAPSEIPRCIFKNGNGANELSFGLARMDYKGNVFDSKLWKNDMERIAYKFVRLCQKFRITVDRVGFVVQTNPKKECIEEVNQYISLPNYAESNEKAVNWLYHNEIDSIKLNEIINIQINENNIEFPYLVMIDINTQKDFALKQDEESLEKTAKVILDEIEERLKNVF